MHFLKNTFGQIWIAGALSVTAKGRQMGPAKYGNLASMDKEGRRACFSAVQFYDFMLQI